MDWKAAFQENWPYKVAALVLAVLVWFSVTADQGRTEQSVSTRLEIDQRDEEWVLVDGRREVRVTFRGRLGDIFDLPANRPVIRYTIDEVTDSVVTIDLDPSMVSYDRSLSVQPVSVRPSRVELRFARVAEKRVPITIDLSVSVAQGFTLLSTPIVQPETVTVRGAEAEVASVLYLETEPVAAENLEESTTRQLPIRIPPELVTVRIRPPQVLATIRVDSLVERRLGVRLQPTGAAAAAVSLTPDEVVVIFRGPRSVVEELTVRETTASVRVDEVPEGEIQLPVEVSLPEAVEATAEASPASVTVAPTRTAPDTTSAAGARTGTGRE